MLKQILASELPDSEVIVVSNREPYIHELRNDGVKLQIPASGLVSALEPITRTCAGTWIAHGSGSADRIPSIERPYPGAAGQTALYASPRLADGGGIQGLLLRVRE